jgi:hypothetical protein
MRRELSRIAFHRDKPPPPSRRAPGSYPATGPHPLQIRTKGRWIRHHHDRGLPPRPPCLEELAVAAPAAPAISLPPTKPRPPSAAGTVTAAARAGGSGGEVSRREVPASIALAVFLERHGNFTRTYAVDTLAMLGMN